MKIQWLTVVLVFYNVDISCWWYILQFPVNFRKFKCLHMLVNMYLQNKCSVDWKQISYTVTIQLVTSLLRDEAREIEVKLIKCRCFILIWTGFFFLTILSCFVLKWLLYQASKKLKLVCFVTIFCKLSLLERFGS